MLRKNMKSHMINSKIIKTRQNQKMFLIIYLSVVFFFRVVLLIVFEQLSRYRNCRIRFPNKCYCQWWSVTCYLWQVYRFFPDLNKMYLQSNIAAFMTWCNLNLYILQNYYTVVAENYIVIESILLRVSQTVTLLIVCVKTNCTIGKYVGTSRT